MASRTRPLVALLASVALLVTSLIAWATASDRGIGTGLPQVTQSGTAVDITRPAPSLGPAVEAWQADQTPVVDVPVIDATEIVLPEAVEPPRRMRIAGLDIDMPVRATGVLADGQMQLPKNPGVIGWYQFGPAPGEPRGSTVLGGHVDSVKRGVGPLARLASTEVGDRIVVTTADGTPIRYTVHSVARITKAALPVDWLFRPDGAHQLAVVTCGGRFLPEAGGYEDNIVVVARPVAS